MKTSSVDTHGPHRLLNYKLLMDSSSVDDSSLFKLCCCNRIWTGSRFFYRFGVHTQVVLSTYLHYHVCRLLVSALMSMNVLEKFGFLVHAIVDPSCHYGVILADIGQVFWCFCETTAFHIVGLCFFERKVDEIERIL